MARGIFIFIATIGVITSANATSVRGVGTASRSGVATAQNQLVNPASSYTYNYMYPYLNNQMRTTLKPLDPTSPSTSPINAIVRTEQLSAPRRVVSRPTPQSSTNAARSATTATNTNTQTTTQRRVVPRAATNGTTAARSGTNNTTVARAAVATQQPNQRAVVSRKLPRTDSTTYTVGTETAKPISQARCLAEYTACMDRYCERSDTTYNRCYCSSKLSQIDAKYQPQIDALIQQILLIQSGLKSFDLEEFNEYWTEKIVQYTGENSWTNIDNALNIDWSTMENRARGQNAFITGHDYCSQYIAGCFYMSSNLRDAYRSTISRDCVAYESGLERLVNVAESVIEAYKE